MTDRRWRGYLVAGGLALGAFLLAPSHVLRDVVYELVGVSCVVAIGVGMRWHRPQRRVAWRLMMLGLSLWVIGDALSSWYQDIAHLDAYPNLADAFYLAAYPILAASLVALIRGRMPRRDLAGLLDSVTLTAGLALLSWVVLARPTWDASRYSWSAATVAVAYPLADIVLVAVLIRLVTTPGARTPAFRFLLAAVVLLVAADTVYDALSLWTAADSSWLDLGWLASYLAWGAAALHPSMATLSHPTPGSSLRFTTPRLLALGGASLIAPGILAVEQALGSPVDIWPVIAGCTVMFLLVVARMALSIRQIVAANRERVRLQDDLAYQASHDVLTGLSNRAQAMHDIEAALNRARRSGELLGMLFVDLDGFKSVNDSYGHLAGDAVLRAVAERLQELVRCGDLVARLGGDEFVILLEAVAVESDVVQVAHRVVETIAEPFALPDGHCALIGASVGVTISQDASIDPNRVLHEADTAAYRAKRAGRGRVEIFDNALRLELAERTELEAVLRHAIEHDELTVHYQPITALDDNTVHGYEALVRWGQPDGSILMPDSFIPTAELSDLICDLDTWVLNHATRQVAEWDRAGMPVRTIAVNISGRHVSNARIVRDVETALTRAGLEPSRLIVEITETVLMDDVLALDHLRRLQALGVAISIDDFGTGYNSVTRLKNLPVDIIKIDRAFLDRDQHSAHTLLELIIRAAHTFGLPVVAEGIEHPSQLDLVTRMSCEFGQGFLLAEPLTAAQVTTRETVLDPALRPL